MGNSSKLTEILEILMHGRLSNYIKKALLRSTVGLGDMAISHFVFFAEFKRFSLDLTVLLNVGVTE